ncbi:MAG TPA: NosD domain-containing protein [Phototrophicaceae bacterium]|nr:NosD domain-containing protein [Phototrophicaceae bacterium]
MPHLRALSLTRLFALLAVLVLSLSLTQPAQAQTTYTVTDTIDDADDGICDITRCTLTEAITNANGDPQADIINFDAALTGQTISLGSSLPPITQPITLNGDTISIERGGTVADGLTITVGAGGSSITGLTTRNFTSSGIRLDAGANGNTLTNITSNNNGVGILVNSTNNTITGGSFESNVTGIQFSAGADNNTLTGSTGINYNQVGVRILSDSNTITGNTITDSDDDGVTIQGSSNQITTNRLENNMGSGISVTSGTGNRLTDNQFLNNTDLPIDLGNNGTSETNDNLDPDAGANNQQNYPVITLATQNVVVGTFNSEANGTYQLQFYSNDACDAQNGNDPISTDTVTTDASGNGSFEIDTIGAPDGYYINAIATDASGNTSEFSACTLVTAAPIYRSTPAPSPDAASTIDQTTVGGTPVYATITVENPGTADLDITNVVLSDITHFTPLETAFTVAASGSHAFSVQCNADPVASLQNYTTTISVTHNGANLTPPALYTFNCTVNPGALPQFSANYNDGDTISWYAPAGGSVNNQINVSNTGDPGSILDVSGILTGPANVFSFESATNVTAFAAVSINQGDNELIDVFCKPPHRDPGGHESSWYTNAYHQ